MLYVILISILVLVGGGLAAFFARSGASPEPVKKTFQTILAGATGSAIAGLAICYAFWRYAAIGGAASGAAFGVAIAVVIACAVGTWLLADVNEPSPVLAALRKIGGAAAGSTIGFAGLLILAIILITQGAPPQQEQQPAPAPKT